jgi:hypothetical protein
MNGMNRPPKMAQRLAGVASRACSVPNQRSLAMAMVMP